MRFDIIRAWKDEGYRQGLSDEQLSALPANPAGELTSAEMTSVNGGCCGGAGAFFANASEFHSLAIECNEALFSFTTVNGGFTALSPVTPICINDQD